MAAWHIVSLELDRTLLALSRVDSSITPLESKSVLETCLLVAMVTSTSDYVMQVRRPMQTMDSQTWICVLSFLKTTQPRACTLGCLRCQSRTMRATFQDISSSKLLNLSEICNWPDYPWVQMRLHGQVHPLVGLEPTYAPGRPRTELLPAKKRTWTKTISRTSSFYDALDIVSLPCAARQFPARAVCRAASAPPSYPARDDWPTYPDNFGMAIPG